MMEDSVDSKFICKTLAEQFQYPEDENENDQKIYEITSVSSGFVGVLEFSMLCKGMKRVVVGGKQMRLSARARTVALASKA